MMTSSGKQTLEYIVKKAAKRLHFLKILKGYNAPGEDLKTVYISAIGSILEYGTKDIERIQRRGMKIICPEKTYEQALIECGMETLENRREKMCIKLINDMKSLIHKLNEMLPPTVGHVWERDTRLINRNKFYNFKCRAERFSNSPLVYAFAIIILQLITYSNF